MKARKAITLEWGLKMKKKKIRRQIKIFVAAHKTVHIKVCTTDSIHLTPYYTNCAQQYNYNKTTATQCFVHIFGLLEDALEAPVFFYLICWWEYWKITTHVFRILLGWVFSFLLCLFFLYVTYHVYDALFSIRTLYFIFAHLNEKINRAKLLCNQSFSIVAA